MKTMLYYFLRECDMVRRWPKELNRVMVETTIEVNFVPYKRKQNEIDNVVRKIKIREDYGDEEDKKNSRVVYYFVIR